jgi:Tol biopolymer transport system component
MKFLQRLFSITLLSMVLSVYVLAAEPVSPSIRIAFFAEHEGGLYILDYTTGQIKQINVEMLNVGNLAYSQKRNFLAFEGAKEHEEPQSLYLLDLRTNKKERIFKTTNDNEPLYRPCFDPTGQFLYAVNYDKGVYRYSLAKKNWESVHIVGSPSLNPQGLSFSISGNKIAISPGNFQGFLIGEIKEGTIIIKEHILTDFNSCISPQWAGENELIFAGRKVAGLQFLWKLDLVSKNVTQLSHPPIGSRDFLTLSNDKKTIVFTGTSEKLEWRLWKISVDGSGLQQLTRGGGLSSHLSPVWIEL